MRFPSFISLLVFLGALAWWLWPSSENAASTTSAQTPTATAEEIALPVSGPQNPVADSNEPTPEEAGHAGPKPSPAEAGANSVAGIRLLDSWHRASALDRGGVVDSARGAEGKALQNFASLWNGGSDAYRAVLKNQIPAQLGAEFASYAEAWKKRGLKGLDEALATAVGPGPAWFVWSEAFVDMCRQQRTSGQQAGVLCGKLIKRMIVNGYSRERILELIPMVNDIGDAAGGNLPGENYVVASGDSYWALCRKWADLGRTTNHGWVRLFNGRTRTGLRAGETLSIPKVDISVEAWRDLRITSAWAGDYPVRLWDSSMGEEAAQTPLGEFSLGVFLDDPTWTNPRTGEQVPAGNPDNPLGTRWMAFKEQPSYGIHGTQDASTIGNFESWGCIRLRNEDAEYLFDLVGPGARVTIHP